jgi:hypothetical protein
LAPDRELVELERDQQRGGDDGQVFGPELIEPKGDTLDRLERASAADDPLGELAEVGGEMEEQVGAGRTGGDGAGSVRSRSGEG